MATPLAAAFIRIRPETDRFQADTEKQVGGSLDKAGANLGKRLGNSLAKSLGAALQAAGADLGKEVADEFAKGFGERVKDKTRDAPVGPDRPRTRKQGEESGGSFADGFRRQLEQATRKLPPITVGVAKDAAEQELRDLSTQLRNLAGKTIGVDLDAATALAQVRVLQGSLTDLAANSPDIQIRADSAAALAALAQVTAAAERLDGSHVEVEVDVDTDRAARGVATLATGLSGMLGRAFEGVSGTASTFFSALSEGAVRSGGQITTALVGAAASTAAMTAATGGLNLVLGVLAAAALAGAAAIAAVTVGFVVLAPVILAAGGLLGGFVTALFGAVAAGAVLKLGLGGIGGALSAMTAAQDDATKSSASFAGAQNAIRSAADQVKSALAGQANTQASVAEGARRAAQQVTDAERALSQVRKDAARDVQQQLTAANRRLQDSQLALTLSERDALRVRQDLTRAQAEARQNLEDLESAVRNNSLDQQQAALDVADAQRDLNKVLTNPRSTAEQRRQAQITYDRQVQQVKDLQTRGKRLAAEQADANRKGVEGSDQVVAARERIAAADRSVVAGQRDLKDAQQQLAAVDEARLQGQQRIAAAERALADARRAQTAQQRQGSYQLAQASQAVVAAQRALAQASTKAGDAGGSALQKLNKQMQDLSPNAQKLVRTLFNLRGPFGELRKFVQDKLLDGVSGQVQELANRWLPALKSILGDVADRFNRVADGIFKALGDPNFIKNVKTAVGGFGDMISRIGDSIPDLIDAFGRIGAKSAPVLKVLGDLIGGIFDKFSDWIKTADETGKLDTFMQDAAETLRQIFRIGGLVFRIVGQIVKIFFPQSQESSEGFLGGVESYLRRVLDWLADPANQQRVRDWVAAVGRFVADTAVWMERIAGWIDTVDGWITRLQGWADTVGAFFGAAGREIGDGWAWVRDNVFVPLRDMVLVTLPGAFGTFRDRAAGAFGDAYTRVAGVWANLRDQVFGPLRTAVTAGIPGAFAAGRDAIGARFAEAGDRIAGGWRTIRDNVFAPLRAAITEGVPGAFGTARDRVGARFAEMRARLGEVWADVRDNVLAPLRNAITTAVPGAFQTGVDAVRNIWTRLQNVAREPVRFVIETVLNQGLIGGYNRIAGVLPGVNPLPTIPLPRGFATGGVLPGYTPGRDVHRFVSPTGGVLDLSGGEPVMRPEFGRVVGKDWVDSVNQAARTGGVGGVKRALSGEFASGGIVGRGGTGDGLGDLWKAIRGKATDVIDGAKGAAGALADPAGTVKGLVDRLVNLVPGRDKPWGKLVTAMPRKLLEQVTKRLSTLLPASSDAGASGPGNGASPFGGSAGMMRALRAQFPGLKLISGFRPGAVTLSGNRSYHSADRAVDVPPDRNVAQFIFERFRNITRELITPYQEFNLHNGKPHRYTGAVWNQHNFAGGNAHDHWAARLGGVLPRFGGGLPVMDTGGWLAPGWNPPIFNGTGRAETVTPAPVMDAVIDRLDRVVAAIEQVAPGVAGALTSGTRRAVQLGRSSPATSWG